MRRLPGATHGFTVIELMFAVCILSVALVALVSSTTGSMKVRLTGSARLTAARAAEDVLERIRADGPALAFALYNASDADDPDGPGTAPGPETAVATLRDGLLRIEFPTVVVGADLLITETLDDASLGMDGGRDLDGDGTLEAAIPVADCLLLPVRVVVTWSPSDGGTPLTMSVASFVSERQP